MSEKVTFDIPKYTTVARFEPLEEGAYCYIAFHPELPDLIGQGDTLAEARESLVEATALAIEYLITNNLPVPEPKILGAGNVTNLAAHEPVISERVVISDLSVRTKNIPGFGDKEVQTEISARLELLAIFDLPA